MLISDSFDFWFNQKIISALIFHIISDWKIVYECNENYWYKLLILQVISHGLFADYIIKIPESAYIISSRLISVHRKTEELSPLMRYSFVSNIKAKWTIYIFDQPWYDATNPPELNYGEKELERIWITFLLSRETGQFLGSILVAYTEWTN